MSKGLAFHVGQDDGMLVAVCHEPEMATQGETLEELIAMIRDLVRCRFDAGDERLQWPICTALSNPRRSNPSSNKPT